MKKRLLAALVSGAMLISALAGCGSSGAQTSGDDSAGQTANQDYHIKVILKTLASEYWQYVGNGCKQAGEDLGVTVDVLGASSETAYDEQLSMIETTLSSSDCDAMVVAPLQAETVATQIAGTDLPIVAIDTAINSDKVLSFVGFNNEELAAMGGKAAAEKRLDEFFVRLDAGYNDPWFASGNEPSFHIPWVYNWLGRPDKTSKVINRILNEQYTSAPDGLPGNDDLGTMGAWYVFACTGLYPMIPGVGGFTLSTPVFDKVVIHLKHGDITITGGSEKQIYTTALKLDGKPYGSTWIGWDALRNGATLEYTTSAKPSGNWGRTQLPPSYE